jgi:hypothetical protein
VEGRISLRTIFVGASGAEALAAVRAPDRVTPDRGATSSEDATARWEATTAAVRHSPALRESILQSVMRSMAFEGLELDREESERLLDLALSGPPLEYPGTG